ncbi:MAG: hypothetical protein ABEJ36_00045 [Candidatus Nanosalina sp.]
MTEGHQEFKTILRNRMELRGGISKDEAVNRILDHEESLDRIGEILKSCNLAITESEKEFLEDYRRSIEEHEEWAAKIDTTEDTRQKKETLEMIKATIDQLKRDIDEVIDEDAELESIAQALEDRKLENKAELNRKEVRELKSRLEELAEKEEKVERFLNKLESLENQLGGLHNLTWALEHRKEVIQLILEKSDRRPEDKKRIEVTIPPWERERFDRDHTFIDLKDSTSADNLLEILENLIEFIDSERGFRGDTGVDVEIKIGEIEYAHITDGYLSPENDSHDFSLYPDQEDTDLRVWKNAAFTFDPDNPEGELRGDKAVIVMDERMMGNGAVMISTIIHELMHAYLEHTGDYTHLDIHKFSIEILRTAIDNFEAAQGIDGIGSTMNEKNLKKAYKYSLCSAPLFPDK